MPSLLLLSTLMSLSCFFSFFHSPIMLSFVLALFQTHRPWHQLYSLMMLAFLFLFLLTSSPQLHFFPYSLQIYYYFFHYHPFPSHPGLPIHGDKFFFFLVFLGPHVPHVEVPRLEAQLELQPPAYATATAMPDLSRVCDLYHSPRQCWILNPLSEARDPTHNHMVPSQIRFCCGMMGTPWR